MNVEQIDEFLQKEIYHDKNLEIIIDNVIATNYFDFKSTIAIFMQRKDTILAFSEWRLRKLDYSIYEETEPIIVPLPIKYFTYGSDEKNINLANTNEKEQILLGKIKTNEHILYKNHVFFDLRDTNCNDYDRLLNQNIYCADDTTELSIGTLCTKSGVNIVREDLKKLEIFSLYSKNTIFLEQTLSGTKCVYFLMKSYLEFLFFKTSTQNIDVKTFEYNLCVYILCKKFNLKIPTIFPKITASINALESVTRSLKMSDFFMSKIFEFEDESREYLQNESIPQEYAKEEKKGMTRTKN